MHTRTGQEVHTLIQHHIGHLPVMIEAYIIAWSYIALGLFRRPNKLDVQTVNRDILKFMDA